jgi:hypothetical protein
MVESWELQLCARPRSCIREIKVGGFWDSARELLFEVERAVE